jgi:hypothetical protein
MVLLNKRDRRCHRHIQPSNLIAADARHISHAIELLLYGVGFVLDALLLLP